MTSIRALANLFCSNCNEVTLHRSNVCTAANCNTPNKQSGNAPLPRPPTFNTLRGKNYDPARQEHGDALRRARQARHRYLNPRGRP